MQQRKPPPPRQGYNLGRAFLGGLIVGAILGALASWIDYGAFSLGYMSNYVLGFAIMAGLLFLAIAAIWNRRRNRP